MGYGSEAAKVRELPQVMKYVTGKIIDIACGGDKITPEAFGVDGRALPGVDLVLRHGVSHILFEMTHMLANEKDSGFDTVFSSHLLEHLTDPKVAINTWFSLMKDTTSHLVLYLPDGDHYNNQENPEHMQDMKYEPFMFWFRRVFCGDGKDFNGVSTPKMFEIVEHGLDLRPDCYSFYVVARRVMTEEEYLGDGFVNSKCKA